MATFTVVVIILFSFSLSVALLVYGIRGRRQSQAQDSRTYKRGRI